MFKSSLYRSSDERGSCKSFWSTHERTHASLYDYEDMLFLVDYGDQLLSGCSKMPRVPDSWQSYSCIAIKVTCFNLAMAIFGIGY